MWKVSVVGYSQLPWKVDVSGAEIPSVGAPGGRMWME